MARAWRDLVSSDDSMSMIREWCAAAGATVLPTTPDDGCRALEALQITTHSTLGALAFHTGGVLVDHGWLRLLGAGSPRLPRALDTWNFIDGTPRCAHGILVADDVMGGFFAWFREPHTVHYFAPDSLEWEDSALGFTEWLQWSLSDRLTRFYEGQRWEGWESEVQALDGAHGVCTTPPLFTTAHQRTRRPLAVDALWRLHLDYQRQLEDLPDGPIELVRKR